MSCPRVRLLKLYKNLTTGSGPILTLKDDRQWGLNDL